MAREQGVSPCISRPQEGGGTRPRGDVAHPARSPDRPAQGHAAAAEVKVPLLEYQWLMPMLGFWW